MDKRVEHCLKNKCRDCQIHYKYTHTHLQKCRSDITVFKYKISDHFIFNKTYLESILWIKEKIIYNK